MNSNFTLRSRMVTCSHNTAPTFSITYSSVVTRERVKLAFIISGMKYIYICAFDIGNAYLNAPCQGKLLTEGASEFGSEKGHVFLIV